MDMDVFIPDELKSQNPNFARLIERLQSKVNVEVDEKLEEEHHEAKLKWLSCQILYLAVKNVLEKFQYKIVSTELSSHESKCWNAVKNFFTINECKSYVSNHKDESLLGLDLKNLHNCLEPDDLNSLEEGKSLLRDEVENYLSSLCLKLTELHDEKLAENSKILKSRSVLMGEMLESEAEEIKAKQKMLKESQENVANAYLAYKQTLQWCAEHLTTLLNKYWLNLQPKKDHITVRNARACVETLSAKLRLERLSLKRETYTLQRVEALKKIRAEIEETTKQREYELSGISRQLAQYRQLGSEFEAVVTEYGNVCSDLEKQAWALEEIKRTSKHE